MGKCNLCKQHYNDWENHWMKECPYGDGEEWAEPEENEKVETKEKI